MPFSPVPAVPVQFARIFQSATGIIVFTEVAIAASDYTDRLMEHAEQLWFVIGQM
jgi:hypothetical protein